MSVQLWKLPWALSNVATFRISIWIFSSTHRLSKTKNKFYHSKVSLSDATNRNEWDKYQVKCCEIAWSVCVFSLSDSFSYHRISFRDNSIFDRLSKMSNGFAIHVSVSLEKASSRKFTHIAISFEFYLIKVHRNFSHLTNTRAMTTAAFIGKNASMRRIWSNYMEEPKQNAGIKEVFERRTSEKMSRDVC